MGQHHRHLYPLRQRHQGCSGIPRERWLRHHAQRPSRFHPDLPLQLGYWSSCRRHGEAALVFGPSGLQGNPEKMGLQARGTAGVDSASTGGTWDISNSDRLGKSEVQLCNLFIEGLAQVIKWEKKLEAGEKIEEELAAAKPLGI